jgi:hypothetical protein
MIKIARSFMEEKQLEDLAKKSRIESEELRKKALKILLIPILVFLVLTVSLSLFESYSEGLRITFFVFLGLTLLSGFVWLMVKLFYWSEVPLFKIVYPEIANRIFRQKNLFLTYKAYPTEKDEMRKSGFYYPSIAYKIYDQLEFNSKRNHHIRFHQVYVYSSDGNSSSVDLNGVYAMIDIHTRDFQIRQHGHPVGLKSYQKIKELGRYKVYAPAGENNDFSLIVQQLSELFDSLEARDVVVGTYQSRTHVAYSIPRLPKSYS